MRVWGFRGLGVSGLGFSVWAFGLGVHGAYIASGQIGFREFGKQASSESTLSSLCGEGLQGFVATGV